MSKKLIVRSVENKPDTIEFYPVVFNVKSRPIHENGKVFTEIVREGAFENCDMSNCVATLQHDLEKILGRVRANTLVLSVDSKGLKATVIMGSTTLHTDTAESINRGDLDECSFMARVNKHEDLYENGQLVRYIDSFSLLKDVSIVTNAAYAGTDVILRELPEITEIIEMTEKEKEIEALKARVAELEAKEDVKPVEDEVKPIEEEVKPVEDEVKPVEVVKEEEVKEEVNPADEIKRSATIEKNMSFVDEIKNAVTGGSKSILEVKRAAGDGEVANFSNITLKNVAPLSVIGKEPIWAELGCEYIPNANGTIVLPYENPIVAAQLAELAAITKQLETDTGTVVVAKRYAVQKEYSSLTLAQASPEHLATQMENLEKACDRKVTADVFAAVLNGSTAVATTTAINEVNFDKVVGAIDSDNEVSLLMSKSNFVSKKSVKVDGGSGVNLMVKDGKFGQTHDGTPVYFSTLFEDNTAFAAGDMSQIAIVDYNKSEIIIDPFTKAGTGQTIITVVKHMAVALRNPNAFAKSATLA